MKPWRGMSLVLTDSPSFLGHLDFMVAARRATALPVLRKDFMYDTYQVTRPAPMAPTGILIIMARSTTPQPGISRTQPCPRHGCPDRGP